MKKIIYISLLAAVSLFACQKTNFELYYNQAVINGEAWDWAFQGTDYRTSRNGTFSFNISKSGEFKQRIESISFQNVSTIINSDTIFLKLIETGRSIDFPNIPTASFYISDGDILLSIYRILETPDFPSWLIVERVNDKVIKVKFQAIFVKKDMWESITNRPDTLRVTAGEFLARNLD